MPAVSMPSADGAGEPERVYPPPGLRRQHHRVEVDYPIEGPLLARLDRLVDRASACRDDASGDDRSTLAAEWSAARTERSARRRALPW